MEVDKVIVIIAGVLGIFLTYWFFLIKSDEQAALAGDSIDITVDGGYQPSVISIPKGKTIKINFFRKDQSSCLEEVVLSDFKIKRYLPMNKTVTVEINPKRAGEFSFSCGMNMNHGKIKVV